VSLQAVTRTRPGGARIGASVRVALDCRGRIAERPVGRAETIIRWTLDGTAPGPGSRALRAAAPSCTTFARRAVEQGTLSLAAEQAGAIAGLSSPGEQGLAVPGGTFPRPAPPLRVWLELRLGGRVLIATRARFTQRVVRARFCTGAGSGRSCRLRRHVETDVAPDAGPCPGMPEGRCRAFTRRLS
jgi:hypothetical protein